METMARLERISANYDTGRTEFTFSTDSQNAVAELERLREHDIRLKATRYRKKRSLSANGLFWHCIGQMAEALRTDKWDVYLSMLRQYGKFTYICVKPNMVEAVKDQWRESMEWSSVDINGKPATQMLCFFGSSSYNTKEMSRLIDGTIHEMKELGLDPPMPQDIQIALEQWETYGQHTSG